MEGNLVGNYGWHSVEGPHSCDYLSPEIIRILRDLNVQRVLDVGSGNGRLCFDLSSAGFLVTGVDNDIEGVKLSRSVYPHLKFYYFGVQDDPMELVDLEGAFDAVVSTEVIEHLFSPHLLPRYARATIRKGGYLIVTTPYHGYIKNLALSILNKWDFHHTALWEGGHIKFWSRSTLAELLENNGFNVIRFKGVGRFPYLWKSMILVARAV